MGQTSWLDEPVNQSLGTVAAVVAMALLADGARRLRHTTLIAPVIWGVNAVVGVAVAGWWDDPFVDYAAGVLLIAPTLALLGSKRPQNGAWQFIVLTLVCVLLLPALQGLAFGDAKPHVHSLFRWLIGAHIVIGVVNYLPTRYFGAALFVGAAQTFAATKWQIFGNVWHAIAALLAVGLAWVWITSESGPPGLEKVWRDFRDAYGLVWGLRIAERLNASAQKHGWPVEFTWGGMLLCEGTTELDAETKHRVERELRSHLRRFVSHDWIARRLHEPRA